MTAAHNRDPRPERGEDGRVFATGGADAATNTAHTIDITWPISLTSGLLGSTWDSGSSLTIAGSGAAGCEYASIFAALGTRVTIAVTCSRQSTQRWPGSSANASMPWGSA